MKLSILVPVRNEGVNLKVFIKVLETMLEIEHEVLVIYDSPDDDSIPVVAALQKKYSNVRPVHNTAGRGVVNAIKTGVRESVGDVILITVCDEAGVVFVFDDMLALIQEGCDFVSGTRYAHGGRRLGGSWIGGRLSRLANRLLRILSRSALTDATTGLKMLRRAAFEQLHLEARPIGWAVTFEMALKAQLAGLKLGEVPVVSVDRIYGGKSTFRLGPWFKEYARWFLWSIKTLPRVSREQRNAVRIRIPSTTAI
jgi:dolichol-phosphate mannosyltransferase